MKKLNYYWRIIATGLCFFMFGFGGLLLTLLILPLVNFTTSCPHIKKGRARQVVHYAFKFFVALMRITGVISVQISHAKRFKTLNGQLVLANHPSLIDVVILISLIPNADCVVKSHLFKNPFIRNVLMSTGYISNSQSDELINDCKASLAQGNNLIVFPEGTRTTPGETLKFQRGAANIALRCEASITRVLISVEPNGLTKDDVWYNVPEEKMLCTITLANVDEKITPEEPDNLSKESRVLTRYLQEIFTEELQSSE